MDTYKDVYTYYKLCGREDNYGNKMIDTSLRELIWNWLNFIEDVTLLRNNARNMGEHTDHIIVNGTPKFHPNIVGEVID